MDEDPIQRRIYFLIFVESLEMIFSQYTETCEVLLYYPKNMRGGYSRFYKNSIRDIVHERIDVNGRILISELPEYEIK